MLVLVSATSAATARADVIEMPMSCPESSSDAFCHGPATCAPRSCVSPTDCMAGEVCAARDLCTETHTCFGFPMGTLVSHVLGACDASGACPTGGTCGSFFVCAPGPFPVDAGPAMDAGLPGVDAGAGPEHVTYCGCRAGTQGGSTIAWLTLAVALAIRSRRGARR